jgi:hypothetical protein
MLGDKLVKTCYGDTDSDAQASTSYQWGDIYTMFRDDKYPPTTRQADQEVYRKRNRSEIHRVAARPAVFPCADIITWLIPNVDLEDRVIRTTDKQKAIASFQPSALYLYYKFPRVEVTYSKQWIYDYKLYIPECLKSWWVPRFKVRAEENPYPTACLREPYRILAMLMARIYGEPNAANLHVSWVPLMHAIATKGITFNWSAILSTSLQYAITVARHPGPGSPSCFYMSSYMLDIVCAANPFPGLRWMWQPSEPAVHIYCSMLW